MSAVDISTGDLFTQILNYGGASIGGDAVVNVTSGTLTVGGNLAALIDNTGGSIGGNANINFSASSNVNVVGDATFQILNNAGTIGSDAEINVSAANIIANSLVAQIDNSGGGMIGTGGNISFTTGGDLVTTGGGVAFTVQNTTGTINTGGNLTLTVGGSLATQALTLFVENYDGVSTKAAGHIGIGGNLFVTTGGDLTADSIDALINNRTGGRIDSGGSMIFTIGGALTTTGDAGFTISSRFNDSEPNGSMLGSVIGSDVTLLIDASSVNIGGISFSGISNSGSTIDGSAIYTWDISGDMTIQGDASLNILNDGDSASPPGGTLHGNATIQVSAANFSAGSLFVEIDNRNDNKNGGVIDSDATISFNIAGNLSITSDATFEILNHLAIASTGGTGGTIGSDAMINVTAANLTAGSLFVNINNRNDGVVGSGGAIDSNATINFNIAGNLITQTGATFFILNALLPGGTTGGTIGADATINVTAASISPGVDSFGSSLHVRIGNNGGGNIGGNAIINFGASDIINALGDATFEIDNSNGGTIGGNATINMNISGNATVASDATVQILGSDGAAAAAIAFNGGSYTVGSPGSGGTFLSSIDGNGTITFNNASVHADVIKAGVFGANGVLNIGGGVLTADTTLELYAPGSNGQLNFTSNVTLDGISAKILAADSVTIFNNVVVTIGDDISASVYTNHANYTGFGGNGSRTGTFAGAGASQPLPLSQAPPFGPTGTSRSRGAASADGNVQTPSSGNIARSGRVGDGNLKTTSRNPAGAVMNVSSTDQLLSLLDAAAPGPGGRITIPASKRTSNGRNSSGINAAGRLNADRRALDIRTASSLPARRLPQ